MNPLDLQPLSGAPSAGLQYTAYFLGLIEMIVGLYVLALNFRHTANQHAVISANSFTAGGLLPCGLPLAGTLRFPARCFRRYTPTQPTGKRGTSMPGTSKPGTSKPGTSKPGTSKRGTSQ